MDTQLTNCSVWSYSELEKMNLKAKKLRANRVTLDYKKVEKDYRDYLKGEKGIKAVTVAFSDLEGRFHMLDYDKKHLLNSSNNLTFDGSSIKGFSSVDESDLRLKLDWASFYWLPADIFGAGKVLIFADIYKNDNSVHSCDFRARLKELIKELYSKKIEANVGSELEGFLFKE